MDWKDLGKSLISLGVPALGTALLGPLGGMAGKVLADTLGTEATPEAIDTALKNDPAAVAAAKEADAEWAKTAAISAQAAAAQGAAVNETIRAEVASGVSWWHWRHLIGYLPFVWGLAVLPPLARDLWTTNATGLNLGIQMATALLPYFLGILGILGYVANDTSKLRQAAMNGAPSDGALGTLLKGLAAKVAR